VFHPVIEILELLEYLGLRFPRLDVRAVPPTGKAEMKLNN
jgi:hypothetical protein